MRFSLQLWKDIELGSVLFTTAAARVAWQQRPRENIEGKFVMTNWWRNQCVLLLQHYKWVLRACKTFVQVIMMYICASNFSQKCTCFLKLQLSCCPLLGPLRHTYQCTTNSLVAWKDILHSTGGPGNGSGPLSLSICSVLSFHGPCWLNCLLKIQFPFYYSQEVLSMLQNLELHTGCAVFG